MPRQGPGGPSHSPARRTTALRRTQPRFGNTHWYADSMDGGCGDWTAWCLAERGKIVRYYHLFNHDGDAHEIGLSHPAEEPDVVPNDALVDGFHDFWATADLRDYDDPEAGAESEIEP